MILSKQDVIAKSLNSRREMCANVTSTYCTYSRWSQPPEHTHTKDTYINPVKTTKVYNRYHVRDGDNILAPDQVCCSYSLGSWFVQGSQTCTRLKGFLKNEEPPNQPNCAYPRNRTKWKDLKTMSPTPLEKAHSCLIGL